jgi:hypothetical protein
MPNKSKTKIKKIINKTAKETVDEFRAYQNVRIDELHVYDFDDTLVSTKGNIFVLNKNTGVKKQIETHAFHEYHLQEGEVFDITQFNVVIDPKLLPHFYKFQNDYEKYGKNKVAILTARAENQAIYDFLKPYGMDDIRVVAIGDAEPMTDVSVINATRKTAWLRKQLETNPIKFMSFYDDNVANITMAKTLEQEFPDVIFEFELVVQE